MLDLKERIAESIQSLDLANDPEAVDKRDELRAMDIVCDTFRLLNSGFAETQEGQWLYANCQRFGFIVRYRREWSDVTGYAAEPWHFRYVGVDTATAIWEVDEFYSFEEYFDISGGDYED